MGRHGHLIASLVLGLAVVGSVAAADAASPPFTRMISCPAGMTCTPLAIDAAGRLVVYSVRSTSRVGDQLLVRDTVANVDRTIAVSTAVQFSTVTITDDGRYVLYYDGAFVPIATDNHAYDTATGSIIDIPAVTADGLSYFLVDRSRDLRYALYGGYRDVSGSAIERLFVYDREAAAANEIPLNGRTPVFSAHLSPDGRYVSYSSAVGTWIVDRLTGSEMILPQLGGGRATFTSDSQYLISAGTTFETATGRPVARSPDGPSSADGRYIVYRCSEDPRDPTFCVYDQLTTLTSRLPSVGDPVQRITVGGAVVDNRGRVAFYSLTPGGDVYMTCGSYFVPPPNIMSTNLGVTATVRLTVSSGDACGWTAQSNVPWLTITSPTSGAGTTDLTYVVSTNSTGRVRAGTLTIAGQTFVVTQGQNPNAAPGAPVSLRAPHNFGSLTWSVPVDGGTVTNYIIEGGSLPGLADRFRVSTGETTTSAPFMYVDRSPLYVRVKAANPFGESIASNEVVFVSGSATGRPCIFPPDAPQAFNARVDGSTVTLSWSAFLPFEGASYIIEAGSAGGLSNLANYITGNTTPGLLVPGVTAGTYFARVRAIDVCGVGPPSNEIVVTVP